MVIESEQVSRRALLGASGAAGGALMLAACGSHTQLSKLPAAVRSADVTVLNELLDVEHLVVTGYVAAIPLLSHHNLRAARHFLDQELKHIKTLQDLIHAARGAPHGAKSGYDLGHPRTATELLELLRRVEDRAIRAYLDAIPKFRSSDARQTAASILAVEAQHTSIIRRNLGLTAVPSARVLGAE